MDRQPDELKRAQLREWFALLPRSEAVRLLNAFQDGLFNQKPVKPRRIHPSIPPSLPPSRRVDLATRDEVDNMIDKGII